MPVSASPTQATGIVSLNASTTLPTSISSRVASSITRAPTRSIAAPAGPVSTNPASGGSASISPTSLSPNPRTSLR